MRQASELVCDDFRPEITGKATAAGLSLGDVVVPADPFEANQMVVSFSMQGEPSEPSRSLKVIVQLPAAEMASADLPAPEGLNSSDERKGWTARFPFFLSRPILRPGKIMATVIHDLGEIAIAAPWIVTVAAMECGSPAT